MRNSAFSNVARAGGRAAPAPLGTPIAARLELISGARAVWITAVDAHGARLRMDSPPPLGVSALLKWDDHEHFATVSSAGDGECALKFDRHASGVAPAAGPVRSAPPPRAVAALDQMQTRKRRKALVLDHSADAGASYEWVVRLGRRNAPIGAATSLTMEEQMFFYRAPLAHLVDRRRANR